MPVNRVIAFQIRQRSAGELHDGMVLARSLWV